MKSKEALLYLATTDRNTEIGDEAKKILWKLVERDTPKKPLLVEVSADNEHHYVCSFCNDTINIGDSIGYNKVFNVFCRECGQRLDWSERYGI